MLLPPPRLRCTDPNQTSTRAQPHARNEVEATTSRERNDGGTLVGKVNKYLLAEPSKVSTEGAERSSRRGAGRKHPLVQFPMLLAAACCSLVSLLPLSAGRRRGVRGRVGKTQWGSNQQHQQQKSGNEGLTLNRHIFFNIRKKMSDSENVSPYKEFTVCVNL